MKTENMNSDENTQKSKVPLKFVVEGKGFETTDQYLTGEELKKLANIPLDVELFLKIAQPYEDELIENSTKVNLARPDIEDFFVKKKLIFIINEIQYQSYKQYLSGKQLKELGEVPLEDDLFLDIKQGWEDDLIENNEFVDLGRPGKEKFFSKPKKTEFTIIVNASPFTWKKELISFKELVILAFGSYNDNPNVGYTVTFYKGWPPKTQGTLVKDTEVRVKEKMVFDVTATDKS